MEITREIEKVREIVRKWKSEGLTVGFVPTMGYLHEGHKSLIDRSVQENDRTVVSIFLNPMQFAPNEDLESYPRDFDSDCSLCKNAGAALVFSPEPKEMYSPDFCSFVDMDSLTKGLCGKTRPTHFRGVCTVVSKLFNIVQPDKAYFGEKDAQQLAVIKRMVADLNFPIEIKGCPIIREPDGLAKSSRNTYLSPAERQAALSLSRSLRIGKDYLNAGNRNTAALVKLITDEIQKEPLAKIDYVETVDSLTLEHVDKAEKDMLVAIAVYIGKTRLIDNFTFKAE